MEKTASATKYHIRVVADIDLFADDEQNAAGHATSLIEAIEQFVAAWKPEATNVFSYAPEECE